MKCAPLVTAVALLALFPGSALADWQFTRWGMSVDEVREAAREAGRITDDPASRGDDTIIMIRPYLIAEINFGVAFIFDKKTQRLRSIGMCVSDEIFGWAGRVQVKTALLQSLGKPESDEVGPGFNVSVWKDQARNNTVISTLRTGERTTPGDSCISYFPLTPSSAF